jgi:uncharacterized protein
MGHASPAALASELHGPRHWRAVAQVGLELARHDPRVDIEIVVLFGLLHDSLRADDGRDWGHGGRAAQGVLALAAKGWLRLETHRLHQLHRAVGAHEIGETTMCPTVGACWDADRLNLWRVGVEPAPALLSTDAARSPEVLAWSRTVHLDPPTWAELASIAGAGQAARD